MTTPALFFSVVRGRPSEAEIAALVAVLGAKAAVRSSVPASPVRSRWASKELLLRPAPARSSWR